MSSPLDDLEECHHPAHQEDPAEIFNMESWRMKKVSDVDGFDWDQMKEDQQLYVQVHIIYSEYFDEEFD